MAEKRMISKKITDSDAFIELSSSAQALYFHLIIAADDDGFNNQIQIAMLKSHATVDDLKVLLMKHFIIRFESGVIVIKHWRMQNAIRKDRYTPTNFQEELKQLGIKDNGAYTLNKDLGCQTVAKRLPQYSIGKDSIDKYNKEKDIKEKAVVEPPKQKATRFVAPTPEEVTAYINEKGYSVDPIKFWNFYESKGWYVGKNKMKSWKACVATWQRSDKDKSKTGFDNYNQRTYTGTALNGIAEDINDCDFDL